MKTVVAVIRSLLAPVLVVSLLLGACGPAPPTDTPEPTVTMLAVSTPTELPTATPAPTKTPTAPPPTKTPTTTPTPGPTSVPLTGIDLVFASFEEPVVETKPAVFHEPIASDLGNVRVPFALSETQRERLARDGFVVSPGVEKEFYTIYEDADTLGLPVFVTSDSLLHLYHLLFDKVLRTAEVEYFTPLLRDLNRALLVRTMEEYEALKDTAWEDAARRTLAFVGIASKLLDPDVQVPAYAADLVEAELALIEEASGVQPSPLFPGLTDGEDYSQYIPRGHYTRSADLEAYFKSMMWYGRMTFRLKADEPEVGRAETRSALLLVQALRTTEVDGRPALELWADLYNAGVFFVGRSDDLTVLQYGEVMDEVYGQGATVAGLVDEELLDAFIDKASSLPPPRILGLVIWDSDDEETMTKGLRFMGQRFVPDAYIFSQLVYDKVGTREHRRGLPKGLDILAAMGSERAYQILESMGETDYENYPGQMAKIQDWVSGLTVEEWTETLYNAWLYSFRPLLGVPEEGVPSFMQSPAWVDKQLQTVLGSWAELKHDTILYAKQFILPEVGGGALSPEPVLPKGYVEPVPRFYARLAALTAMTRQGLRARGMLSPGDDDALGRLEELARALQVMAQKELRNEPLTEEEHALIRDYGEALGRLTSAAGSESEKAEEVAAVIADVATDPDPDKNGVPDDPVVLEEAVGRVDEIHVVVPVVEEDGTTTLLSAKGGVFSYYEFPWPAKDRLTDEKWRQMLEEDQAPPRPEWIESFFSLDSEYSDLTDAIFSFERGLGEVFVFLDADLTRSAGDAVKEQLAAQVAPLRAQQLCEYRQLVCRDIRSVDLQTDGRAVVVVRETWQDWLGEFDEDAGYPSGERIAQRGPYSLDVTYTLERDEWGWQITDIVYANSPPAW